MSGLQRLSPPHRLPPWTTAFSEAQWLDEKRITVYSRGFVAIYVAAIIIVLALSPHFIDPIGKPVGTDFLCFWTAGRMALDGHAADTYDFHKQFAMEQKALPFQNGQEAPRLPWLYPPMFMFVAAALGLFPYGVALGVWMGATLLIYLAAIRGIASRSQAPRQKAMMTALAFPAVFSNLGHGQNGFLTVGLLGGGLVLLERRPWAAGILFGLLAYKPQFALLVPLALMAGGCWRAIFAAGLTATGTVALSWAVFGGEVWRAFFASLDVTRTSGLEQGSAGWEKIQSVFSAVRMLGGSVELAYAAQGALAVTAAAAVVWMWRKGVGGELKNAALAVAMLMVTPYVLDYDLIVLALPIAWIAAIGLRDGFLPFEKITLFAAWMLPLLTRMLGQFLHLPVAPIVMALLLAMVLRRAALASGFPRFSRELGAPKVLT